MATLQLGIEEEKLLAAQLNARRAQSALTITRLVAAGTAVFTVVLVMMALLLPQYPQLWIMTIVDVQLAVVSFLYPIFQRRGQVAVGVRLFLLSILLVVAVALLAMPEAILPVTIGYILIIVLGNLLLGNKNSRWLTGVCIIVFGVSAFLTEVMEFHWFKPLDPTTGAIINVLFGVFALLVVAVITHQIIASQETAVHQSQRANLEIEKQTMAERQQREHLQITITHYVDYMALVRQGDLTARLSLNGHGADSDPLQVLGKNLNDMTGSLQLMINQIREVATNLSSAAAEILAATTQQVAGASEQSAAISQTTTTVDEVKTISEQAILRLQEVANVSQHTVDVSRTGQQTVQDMIDGMTQIKERVEGIAENILALSEQTQQIGEIIATVGDLAAQSNILALNASIEAARAGENGKSFGVVAVEVRNLAEQSRQATAQVRAILSEIQQATNSAVMATEEGTKEVDRRIQQAAEARLAIEQLATVITESAQTAVQVVAGGRQQAAGVEQIAMAMQNINQATVQSLASTRQTERAAQNLNQLAGSLTTTVGQYQS
ncbi:MAG TPA: methyl-accepting chemotaxis protein [Anaerolineae bacterium]|nr:methyl-accepting chemotaxis protein [Anaerolineae bacterium]